jgi:glutathione S-transferase
MSICYESSHGIIICGVDFDIFEISLKDKPKKMIEISPKGTVPVFVYKDLVLDESIDIMNWAMNNKIITP